MMIGAVKDSQNQGQTLDRDYHQAFLQLGRTQWLPSSLLQTVVGLLPNTGGVSSTTNPTIHHASLPFCGHALEFARKHVTAMDAHSHSHQASRHPCC